MIREPALQASRQLVRRIEDRDAGVLELCEAGLGVPAPCPQKHHALVGSITLADDLFGLRVCSGTRHDESPHPGIVGHMLHDLRERFTVGKACHIGGIRSPSEALQNPVDAVTRRVAERRQIEPGLTAHIGGKRADAA